MYTVRTIVWGQPANLQTFADHAAAREAYDRAIRSQVYQQVHIEGPDYGPRGYKAPPKRAKHNRQDAEFRRRFGMERPPT